MKDLNTRDPAKDHLQIALPCRRFQDIELVTKIQQSIESPGFEGIRLNYQERRIYHWHEELDRRIGIERIPEHPRVEPRLSGMIERLTGMNRFPSYHSGWQKA